ncbi:MAG: hypothetical protein C4555_04360 [Dehalococcoidia bacterium]|nr:MAG: hypothetical protein C4555_04360 [Dehalococcoidia bacterium]
MITTVCVLFCFALAPEQIPPARQLTFCRGYEPVQWHPGNPRWQKIQIDRNNRRYERLCKSKKKR